MGATRPVRIDLRVVAATHQGLDAMVEGGAFRRDLLARLAGFTIELPPLRARRMDIGIVIASILERVAPVRAQAVTMTPEVGEAFLRHEWPHNVRELEQTLSRALVLAGEDPIDLQHLPSIFGDAPAVSEMHPPSGLNPRDERVRLELLEQLARYGGNLTDVARAMGKARMQIHRWCKRFGIDPNVYRR